MFCDATSRYAAQVRELIKQHEGMPIEYTLFSVERADPVFEELAQRKTEMFKVEARYLHSVLKKNLDVAEGLLPKDGWRDYSIDTPDKARIKILMESEVTATIGRETKQALAVCEAIKDWIRQRPIMELQPWLKSHLDAKEDQPNIFKDIGTACFEARMLLSVMYAWNCILIKSRSNKITSGELSKKDIIDDCKKRIKKIDGWKDFPASVMTRLNNI